MFSSCIKQNQNTSSLGSSQSSENEKRKRFRFSEAERIKAIKELFNILCENDCDSEEELWRKVHEVLLYDNAGRFQYCSLRLLKDHMLEQVSKFKKIDSDEATESGKERLQTEWGDKMRTLMTMWDTYERIVENDNHRKSTHQSGKPKKTQQEDIIIAKQIRDAALGHNRRINYTGSQLAALDNEGAVTNANVLGDEHEAQATADNGALNENNNRILTKVATKKRNANDEGVFLYLAEKARLEKESQKDDLRFKEQQHRDNMQLQTQELEYKKARLEFEKEKWRVESEERKTELKKK